jgi:hypothetical protein
MKMAKKVKVKDPRAVTRKRRIKARRLKARKLLKEKTKAAR